MRASLIPLDGHPPIEIENDVTVIGRKEFCDVQLDDPSISKVHLLIVRTNDVLLFRDMGSTNGTKVNGQRVVRGVLMPNDKLNIAACKYQVQVVPDSTANDHGAMSMTPEAAAAAAAGGSSPVVMVYKADDLAKRQESPDACLRRDTPHGELMVQTDEPGRSGAGLGLPPAPPRPNGSRPSPPAPEFVD